MHTTPQLASGTDSNSIHKNCPSSDFLASYREGHFLRQNPNAITRQSMRANSVTVLLWRKQHHTSIKKLDHHFLKIWSTISTICTIFRYWLVKSLETQVFQQQHCKHKLLCLLARLQATNITNKRLQCDRKSVCKLLSTLPTIC